MKDSIRLRIVQEAADLFNANGYRGVTLSELATRLGMSKKTLYLYFSGKEEIAGAVLETVLKAITLLVKEQMQSSDHPLDIFERVFMGIRGEIAKLHPLFLNDIQTYIPDLWAKLEAFRSAQLTFIEQLLKRAMQEGHIRNVNPKLLTAIMLESIERMARPDVAAKYGVTMVEMGETLFGLFMHGLRTDSC
ncbi:TetR/AcrR family transcriptional regulator [Paenibacillus sp. CGMCC 1.16610]|uniref:TetR family transcriptional regulator n=1 Tax=Paenibacillus anseongense TaxID=2682845 RepID=A0ABW9UAZ1_9BACL|nr:MULTISPECIES: TetR/AcrR family transcriptional regulator [Paenibacillus]MBA2937513.1 TetR/AcrR family transcriptional regulator [Paenibacillus sp. CGMCC 1.16610]MVQ36571.1 TetR family transcriptional regulator [Paenibacillus anseongense]